VTEVHRASDSIAVRAVGSRSELKAFIELPYRLYGPGDNWVPPLRTDVRKQLDRGTNPFFRHADAEYFVAWRGKHAVGRISAQVDRHFNEFQGNRWGLWGWFECEDDPVAAAALFDAAAAWERQRGRDRMVGPMSFTTNDECGLLVEGYEIEPTILEPWQPRYYRRLIEEAGFVKAMDLLMWKIELADAGAVHDVIWQLGKSVEEDPRYTLRRFNKRTLHDDVAAFLDIYNASWEKNWGFVPLDDDEVHHYAEDLKSVLDPNWAMVVTDEDGQTAGAALTLPDFNQVLKHLRGRLLPFGWLKALRLKRKIDRVRVFALGVKPKYRNTGIAAYLYAQHFEAAARTGVSGGSMGWVLEVNKPMNRALEALAGEVTKRFRIYERPLEDGIEPAWPGDAAAWHPAGHGTPTSA
jgi:GNAT superfamily N-acetyltransferase